MTLSRHVEGRLEDHLLVIRGVHDAAQAQQLVEVVGRQHGGFRLDDLDLADERVAVLDG